MDHSLLNWILAKRMKSFGTARKSMLKIEKIAKFGGEM